MSYVLPIAACAVQFWAVCAMTRVTRGWRVTGAVFALYALARLGHDWCCAKAGLSPETALQLRFAVLWPLFTLLIVGLSRDHIGRRIFLALDYGAYSAAFLPFCQALVRWKPSAFAEGGALCSIAVSVAAHAIFIFWLLPLVPQGLKSAKEWRWCSLTALAIFLGLYVTGIWPLGLVGGGWRVAVSFASVTVLAWVIFPTLCLGLRLRHRQIGTERSLTLLMGEVRARREVIDAARRLRHDQRHHRIQLSEYLLRGQVDKALAYLEELDAVAGETPTDKLIWCENDTINAIVSGYSRKAAEKGVRLEIELNVGRSVNIPDVEIVAVVANLLDNAIRATTRGGTVSLAIRQRELTFGLTVANPVPQDFKLSPDGLPCVEPGIGMESVRRVTTRRNGAYAYRVENGRLVCQAMMRVREGEGEER